MSGTSLYQIHYLESVVNNDITELFTTAEELIKKAIEERLMVDPIGFSKPLHYSLKSHRRLRISNYRVVYHIEPENHCVLIIAIKYHKDVYNNY